MEVNWSINMLGMLNIQGGMGEALDDQVLSLQMTSALTLDPCQVPYRYPPGCYSKVVT